MKKNHFHNILSWNGIGKTIHILDCWRAYLEIDNDKFKGVVWIYP